MLAWPTKGRERAASVPDVLTSTIAVAVPVDALVPVRPQSQVPPPHRINRHHHRMPVWMQEHAGSISKLAMAVGQQAQCIYGYALLLRPPKNGLTQCRSAPESYFVTEHAYRKGSTHFRGCATLLSPPEATISPVPGSTITQPLPACPRASASAVTAKAASMPAAMAWRPASVSGTTSPCNVAKPRSSAMVVVLQLSQGRMPERKRARIQRHYIVTLAMPDTGLASRRDCSGGRQARGHSAHHCAHCALLAGACFGTCTQLGHIA
jgi:hypothetical protein